MAQVVDSKGKVVFDEKVNSTIPGSKPGTTIQGKALAKTSTPAAKEVARQINETGKYTTEAMNALEPGIVVKHNDSGSGGGGGSQTYYVGGGSYAPAVAGTASGYQVNGYGDVAGYGKPEGYAVTGYDPTTDAAYMEALNALQAAYGNTPTYNDPYAADLNRIYNEIVNRDKFSYDLASDPMYQQYREQYVNQGKLAMRDTMGQAAALTGGYGSSYSQAVGQQQYNAYLQSLNDVVPELYGMARDTYQMEGQDLYNKYNMTKGLSDTEYGKYRDAMTDYWQNINYLANREDSLYTRGANNYWNTEQMNSDNYWNIENMGFQDYWNTENMNFEDYWNTENMNFQDYWNRMNYELEAAQVNASLSGGSSGGYSVSSGGGSSTTTKAQKEAEKAQKEAEAEAKAKLYTSSQYKTFEKNLEEYSVNLPGSVTATTHATNQGRAQKIQDALSNGYITEKDAALLKDKFKISDADYNKYSKK